MRRRAVVTGASGQDGSYLVEYLLGKGYEVYGLYRPSTTRYPDIAQHTRYHVVYGDLQQYQTIRRLVDLMPDEFYHLAALSHVGDSFKHPELTLSVNFNATATILEELRKESPDTKFYFAGTSETLADACTDRAASHLDPKSAHSPYAVSKLAAQELTKVYREAYGMFCVAGISFNHESPRRGSSFVTAKIVDKLLAHTRGGPPLELGKNTFRDWHDARDTVHGMWLALQQDVARDYTFASGEARSVEDFAMRTCQLLGLDYDKAVVWKEGTVENRPWDVDYLRGDPGATHFHLDWTRIFSFEDMIRDMITERNVKYV